LSLLGTIEIYWWLILHTHDLVLIGSYCVKLKGSWHTYRNMSLLISSFLFVSELTSEIA